MKKALMLAAIPAALTLVIYGCGGDSTSDSDTASGTGGTGYVSSGTVTGFGSVFVNGVEFETDSSGFDIEGKTGTQGDLAIGMVVKVNGTINADGITGTASNIRYDDEIQGPISGMPTDQSLEKKSFKVFGTTVIADINTTSYDGTSFDFATLANDNNVEVSGLYDANDDLIATRIELKDEVFDGSSEIELKGIIFGLTGTSFTLNNVNIDASSAQFDDLPNGLVNGDFVEAKGTYDTATNTIIALEIEGKDDHAEDSDEFEVEGFVSNYNGIADFKVNQMPVDATNATLSPSNLILENSMKIEVEGSIVKGVLIATELKLRSGEIKIKATISATDPANNTFEVSPVSGKSITIHVGTETKMENEVNDTDSFSVGRLNPGDFVEVEGYDNGDGSIFASEVEVKEDSDNDNDTVVQGVVEDVTGTREGGTITVLGVEFLINDETSLEDFDKLIKGIVVKIKDKAPADGSVVGTANSIEIETH